MPVGTLTATVVLDDAFRRRLDELQETLTREILNALRAEVEAEYRRGPRPAGRRAPAEPVPRLLQPAGRGILLRD